MIEQCRDRIAARLLISRGQLLPRIGLAEVKRLLLREATSNELLESSRRVSWRSPFAIIEAESVPLSPAACPPLVDEISQAVQCSTSIRASR